MTKLLSQIIYEMSCNSLREVYQHKLTQFTKYSIQLFQRKRITLLELSHVCEELVSAIPPSHYIKHEEIELLLHIADLSWYIKRRKLNEPYIKETLQILSSRNVFFY